MTAVKVWSGGAWVDSLITEKVWVSGAWVEFSPGGGPAYEALELPSPPASPDNDDPGQSYNLGIQFTATLGCDCVGVEWYPPTVLGDPAGSVFAASLWTPAGSRLAYKTFVPVAGVKQDILFDAAFTLSSATDYIVAVYQKHYSFTSGSPVGIQSPSNNITAVVGKLGAFNGGAELAPVPSDNSNAVFHVSPLTTIP